jgi:signal peptidase I
LTLALVAFDVWRRGKTRRTTDRGLALVFVLAVGIWTAVSIVVPDVVRERYLRAFRIPGLSMQPTLAAGDYVFVDLRPFTPRRGEIIVHSTRLNPAERFAKRVLGVAGDVVEFGPEGAYCNGTLAVRSQVPREMLERDDYLGHPGAPYRVPDGTVFVVGDDLPNSNDSRFIGPIPNGALFGRPYKIYWPPQHARPLTRP